MSKERALGAPFGIGLFSQISQVIGAGDWQPVRSVRIAALVSAEGCEVAGVPSREVSVAKRNVSQGHSAVMPAEADQPGTGLDSGMGRR